jgi:peroxiredoxin Q/BCP
MRTLLVSLLCLGLCSRFLGAAPLPVGAPAPHVTATDEQGKPVAFDKVYGHGTTLVYFYHKAGTPGCTAEACSLRDSFTLISDRDGKVAQAFGVPMMGIFPIASRESFIVKDDRIAWTSVHAQTKGSAEEVQKALDGLK